MPKSNFFAGASDVKHLPYSFSGDDGIFPCISMLCEGSRKCHSPDILTLLIGIYTYLILP